MMELDSAKFSSIRAEEHVVLLAVLTHIRRGRNIPAERNTEDLDDVLLALRITQYCMVPVGAIDALKSSLVAYGTDARKTAKDG